MYIIYTYSYSYLIVSLSVSPSLSLSPLSLSFSLSLSLFLTSLSLLSPSISQAKWLSGDFLSTSKRFVFSRISSGVDGRS